MGGTLSTHVPRSYLGVLDHFINSAGNSVCVIIEAKMPQKHGARKKKCCRIGLVFTLDIETDVTAAGFEDGNVPTHVATRNNTRTANQRSCNVRQDT